MIYFVDKLDDAKAKAAIKAQIEADKRERAEKIAREKALRDGKVPLAPAASSTTTTSTSAGTSGEGTQREHKDARLQIRLSGGGQPIVVTLPSESSEWFPPLRSSLHTF